jgi:hypothetical protein
MGTGAHFPDAKGQNVELHTYLHSTAIRNEYTYTYTQPYAFIACRENAIAFILFTTLFCTDNFFPSTNFKPKVLVGLIHVSLEKVRNSKNLKDTPEEIQGHGWATKDEKTAKRPRSP